MDWSQEFTARERVGLLAPGWVFSRGLCLCKTSSGQTQQGASRQRVVCPNLLPHTSICPCAHAHLGVHFVMLLWLGPQKTCVPLLVHEQVGEVHLWWGSDAQHEGEQWVWVGALAQGRLRVLTHPKGHFQPSPSRPLSTLVAPLCPPFVPPPADPPHPPHNPCTGLKSPAKSLLLFSYKKAYSQIDWQLARIPPLPSFSPYLKPFKAL